MKKLLPCFVIAVFLGSCVSSKIITPPTREINFEAYKTLKVELTDEVKTAYSKEGVPMFDGLLRGKLKSLGYSIVDEEEDILLQVKITGFKPGDPALRFFVGFGAGRAVLTYVASFKDKSGAIITEFAGGKAYHGSELVDNPLYKSEEDIMMGMIQHSVIQIGRFIQSNGKLPTAKGEE